ncbi:MAG TPA: hypothetical protein VG328_21210 [Stellaceae bacterium]|nr:hypothetical protein [Stellaceae bacterium]
MKVRDMDHASAALRRQAIGTGKETTRLGEQLVIRRMIHFFALDDVADYLGRVAFNVSDELVLRGPGTREKDCRRIAQGGNDIGIESRLVGYMGSGRASRLDMEMMRGIDRRDALTLVLIGVEMNDARLVMVDPSDGMIMIRHV